MANNPWEIISKGEPTDVLGGFVTLLGFAIIIGFWNIPNRIQIGGGLIIIGIAAVFGSSMFWKVLKKLPKKQKEEENSKK